MLGGWREPCSAMGPLDHLLPPPPRKTLCNPHHSACCKHNILTTETNVEMGRWDLCVESECPATALHFWACCVPGVSLTWVSGRGISLPQPHARRSFWLESLTGFFLPRIPTAHLPLPQGPLWNTLRNFSLAWGPGLHLAFVLFCLRRAEKSRTLDTS